MTSKDIKSEAKEIMDNFMSAIKDINSSDDFILEREVCFREEGEGENLDEAFRERFLSNARKVSGDSILANKADWN